MILLLYLALSALYCADASGVKAHLTLLESARRCDPWAARVALKEADPEEVNKRDKGHFQTALHIATKKSSSQEGRISAFTKNCEAVVALLLEVPGIDIDATDLGGNTALWWAERVGNAAVSRRLRDKGGHMRCCQKGESVEREKNLRRL